MNTAEQLGEFYEFSPAVVDRVSETMDRIQSFDTFRDFFAETGVPNVHRVNFDGYKSNRVLDIKPADYDETEAISISLPMANPLDHNNIFQVASIAAHFPDRRVFAFGNPSGEGYGPGKIRFNQMKTVANGNFWPTVETELKFSDAERLERVYRSGYSYGVEKALAATKRANQDTPAVAVIEPASVVPRALKELGDAFKSSEDALAGYVEANDLPTFLAAREKSVTPGNYILGLARPTNIAVAKGIGEGLFGVLAGEALLTQPDMQMTIAWGSDSELALDAAVQDAIDFLNVHGDHVRAMRMIGHRHALANFLPVQLAILDETFSAAA